MGIETVGMVAFGRALPVGYYGEVRCGQLTREEHDSALQQQRAALCSALGLDANAISATRKEEGMLERLKNLANSYDAASDVESLVELAAYGRALKAEYAAQEVPAPKWLDVNLRLLSGRIKDAHRRQQEEKLRRVEKEIDELRSRDEKRQAREREAADLRQALGLDGELASK